MEKDKFLTLLVSEKEDWAAARCPEFRIGTFADTSANAEDQLFDNVKTVSYVIVNKKERGESVDETLYEHAKFINCNGANVRQYFDIKRS